jgi:hypothetical protein
MSSTFLAVADLVEDISVQFEARRENGGFISSTEAGQMATGLMHAAEMIRLCERQRIALLTLLDRPVVADDLTVVLTPFRVVQGGRA